MRSAPVARVLGGGRPRRRSRPPSGSGTSPPGVPLVRVAVALPFNLKTSAPPGEWWAFGGQQTLDLARSSDGAFVEPLILLLPLMRPPAPPAMAWVLFGRGLISVFGISRRQPSLHRLRAVGTAADPLHRASAWLHRRPSHRPHPIPSRPRTRGGHHDSDTGSVPYPEVLSSLHKHSGVHLRRSRSRSSAASR